LGSKDIPGLKVRTRTAAAEELVGKRAEKIMTFPTDLFGSGTLPFR
jgi:hypothetical protein